ncbi:hypothetical protein HNQ92_002075 [Rhabdobacter roseus]|uniref:Uncharacterized protein n=1 Tax=Rhabdobacter roseus TaxID=1655419 RepID=A0A840TQW9_9BACT|nr:hypothetical protein [Rhabdobacter roseus]MBB5283932.1 hypothetical protein [Rhabdobacter roseus]
MSRISAVKYATSGEAQVPNGTRIHYLSSLLHTFDRYAATKAR